MKRAVLYVVIFIVCFSVSLIMGLPVSWVLQQAPTVKGLDIQGAHGSVWQGQASSVRWQRQNLGQVNWDFQWSSLFTGKAEFSVRFGRGSDMNIRGRGLVGYSLSDGLYAEIWLRRSRHRKPSNKRACRCLLVLMASWS